RPIDQELLHELFIWRNYASASYKDDADQWSCEICLRPPLSATMLTMMVENPESSCRAVVTVNPKLRVINVAFRGTQGLRGFQADFTANLVPWPANQSRTHAHLGFTSTYSSIAPSVLKILGLYAQSFPDYAIVLVGHSLGGAQAAVMAVDLIYHHPEWISRLELYMFNPPRPGDHAMAQLILQKGIKAYRVINHKDKVSSMPPRKSGYSHVGKEVW
ncbi:Alpha/Beta hydrolase protein, partial [Dimargaris cristalligena]